MQKFLRDAPYNTQNSYLYILTLPKNDQKFGILAN